MPILIVLHKQHIAATKYSYGRLGGKASKNPFSTPYRPIKWGIGTQNLISPQNQPQGRKAKFIG